MFFSRVFVFIATVFVLLASFEIGVRIFAPQERGLFMADPFIRTIHKPNVDTVKTSDEFTARIKTNAQGFVGDDFVREKQVGDYRIVAIGDSFTEGFQVNNDETFSYLIGAYNFGMSGSGTTHQLLTYEHYARTYDPDLVIWEFTIGNDFADDILLKDNPSDGAETVNAEGGSLRAFFSNTLQSPRFVIRKLEGIQATRDLLTRFNIVSRGLHFYDKPDEYPFVYDIYNVGEETIFSTAFDTTCALAEKFRDAVSKDGATLLALILPTKEQLFTDDWNNLLEKYPAMKTKQWDLLRPNRVLARCFDDLDIRYLNFYDIYKTRLGSGSDRMYYVRDGHINKLGHQIIAEELIGIKR